MLLMTARFRFSLRFLILGCTVVGVVVGVFLSFAERRLSAIDAIRQKAAQMSFEERSLSDYVARGGRPRLTSIVFSRICIDSDLNYAMTHVSECKCIIMINCTFQDHTMKCLRDLRYLESLGVVGCDIKGSLVSEISQLPRLRSLDLSGSRITSDDLVRLSQIPTLESVFVLESDGVSEESIEKIRLIRRDLAIYHKLNSK